MLVCIVCTAALQLHLRLHAVCPVIHGQEEVHELVY